MFNQHQIPNRVVYNTFGFEDEKTAYGRGFQLQKTAIMATKMKKYF